MMHPGQNLLLSPCRTHPWLTGLEPCVRPRTCGRLVALGSSSTFRKILCLLKRDRVRPVSSAPFTHQRNLNTHVRQVKMADAAPSKYITLVSADEFEFVVLRDAAMISPMIKSMLEIRGKD